MNNLKVNEQISINEQIAIDALLKIKTEGEGHFVKQTVHSEPNTFNYKSLEDKINVICDKINLIFDKLSTIEKTYISLNADLIIQNIKMSELLNGKLKEPNFEMPDNSNKQNAENYNKEKELVRKGEVNSKGKYIKLIVYSNNEPWSKEYQEWNYSGKESLNFTEQRSIFSIPRGEQVTQIIFQTVDGLQYGKIELDYDYLSFLSEERWRELPSGKIVRKFNYKFDSFNK